MAHLCISLIANPPNCWFLHSFLEFPVEISLFKQRDQVDHAELGHFNWTWKKWCLSLILCLSWILFFSNFLFAILDQLKGLFFLLSLLFTIYLPCKFGYLVRAPPLYSWWVLIFGFVVFLRGFLYSGFYFSLFFFFQLETCDIWLLRL